MIKLKVYDILLQRKIYQDYFEGQNMIKDCIIAKSVIVLLNQKKI